MRLTQRALKERFRTVHMWTRGGQRAVHKPLLLLCALGRCVSGQSREVPFETLEKPLRKLLQEFGPFRKSWHPEYPFWRLQGDDLWVLSNAENLRTRRSNTDPPRTELRKHNVGGGFPEEVHTLLTNNPVLISEIARDLLVAHFPESFHQDITAATGLDLLVSTAPTVAAKRDPMFRPRVLQAYEHRCAFCAFNVYLDGSSIGLEAAHIKWKQAKGPDVESNGLALCALHHKLFDRGAMTVDVDRTILVSAAVHGYKGFQRHLLAYHGQCLRQPASPEYQPAPEHLKWHEREVFRGPSRYTSHGGR